jgi:uncharacterized RDD family membrane protein YckC
MFCIKCGKENPEKAKICYYCGALLVNQKPNPEAVPAIVEAEKPAIATPPPAELPPTPPTFAAPNYPNYNQPPYNNNNNPWQGYGQQPPSQSPYNNPWQGFGKPGQPPYGLPPNFGTPYPPRVPVAPNGTPYMVIENPARFYGYNNKEGKQVYAALSNVTVRLAGAVIDTFLMTLPLLLIAPLIYNLMVPGQVTITDQFPVDNPDVLAASNVMGLIFGLYYFAYTVFMTARFGQTLGHRIMGIKVMKLDGSKPDLKTAFIRNLFGFSWTVSSLLSTTGITAFAFLGLLLEFMVLIGFTAAVGSPRKQGWHDKLAETIVVHKFELVKDTNF